MKRLAIIGWELREHVPFTLFGTLTGVVIAVVFFYADLPKRVSETLFDVLHPSHVLLSALVTGAMFRLHGRAGFLAVLVVGYVGSIGIATLSDSLIPYAGEWLLDMPHRHPHIGFIELWYVVNPLALAGVLIAYFRPHTKFPHAGHVLLSTWASLFHMTMAVGTQLGPVRLALIAAFLFLAVWIPCCLSDIVFPLLFAREPRHAQ